MTEGCVSGRERAARRRKDGTRVRRVLAEKFKEILHVGQDSKAGSPLPVVYWQRNSRKYFRFFEASKFGL